MSEEEDSLTYQLHESEEESEEESAKGTRAVAQGEEGAEGTKVALTAVAERCWPLRQFDRHPNSLGCSC